MASARIVVADTDRRAAGILSWLLAEQGFDATVAHPPAMVDQTLRLSVPDLLLVDGDNLDLAGIVARVRREARYSGMRVIAAVRHDATNLGRIPEGADDCIGKPYRAVEVLTRVRAQLRAAEELAMARSAVVELETTIADNRRLEELATTDPLTRILNRRALADRLGIEMERARRFEGALAILLVDIDHFKRVNDTAGHLAGDEVLRQVAGLIQGAVRTVDIVARYGGEEFVVILPETGPDGAMIFAERLRERISSHEFAVGERHIRLTVSVGIATFPTTDVSTADDFFARADSSMYRAKSDGRNQVRD
ncbi:MAG TPA: diguanylate cyclase [Gemmatimonadaceae bacterium]|nr:diguanylate cyclase [Gemmatimonadaceae bacterium]